MWATPWIKFRDFYSELNQQFYNNSDVRTRDMLFMRRMDGVILLTISYIIFTVVGPKLMANRKAYDLKWPMFAYNVVIALFSLWICLELLINSWKAGYNYVCDTYKASYDPHELRVVNAFWWYFVSKAIEFLDTVFMVLKKKNSQITVLHVWHHSFMFPFLYMATLIGPCGQAIPGPIINSFIHVVMYGYYALSLFPALHPYLWWKKYLTQMQLAQFVILVVSSSYGISIGCDFPHSIAYMQLGFLSTLMILFGNFYIQSYIRRKIHPSSSSRRAEGKVTNGKVSHTNGDVSPHRKDL
ncbi:Elongation of very long chain fatty acids protein 2 [Hypsibius exemplaris]|uniref:Elongation of very long chain fatty acids protein n=1 Tax=Hypsibius exemplaris TaxID=2072580 RepID=A0A9X6RJG1_HYPEX|nr:Elongation of very long chain fatty acids protein 2 [Hypsibius exemplaris]